MLFFSNEYYSKFSRSQTNAFTGTFIHLLFNELISKYNLLPAIPPIFTNNKHNLLINDSFRTIDFDNLSSSSVLKTIDFIDKWLYLYLRQSQVKLNSGIIAFNYQINRDANMDELDAISFPYISFVVSISKENYCQELILNEANKLKNIINDVVSKIVIDNIKIKHQILDFNVLEASKVFKHNHYINLQNILLPKLEKKPLLITNFLNLEKFYQLLPFAKNNFLHDEINGVLFQRLGSRNLPINLFYIALQPTYEQISEAHLLQNSFYKTTLDMVYKNSEWSYVVHINLANLLIWLLDKQHYSEIFSGPYGDEFYEAALKNKKDVI